MCTKKYASGQVGDSFGCGSDWLRRLPRSKLKPVKSQITFAMEYLPKTLISTCRQRLSHTCTHYKWRTTPARFPSVFESKYITCWSVLKARKATFLWHPFDELCYVQLKLTLNLWIKITNFTLIGLKLCLQALSWFRLQRCFTMGKTWL